MGWEGIVFWGEVQEFEIRPKKERKPEQSRTLHVHGWLPRISFPTEFALNDLD